ncbi:hypothetical protein [Trichloromonas sp.]|uniref:hypothetical protein n=1 Tax=Trichloromonas sp. TaxID=3069249 RepID=UPI002A43B506|nr:hypothetical protein [Trichloromonas sp.]
MKFDCGKSNTVVWQKSLPCVAFMVKVSLIFLGAYFAPLKLTGRDAVPLGRPASSAAHDSRRLEALT